MYEASISLLTSPSNKLLRRFNLRYLYLNLQIEGNSGALEHLGHGIGGSHNSSLDSVTTSSCVQTSDIKAVRWKQGVGCKSCA